MHLGIITYDSNRNLAFMYGVSSIIFLVTYFIFKQSHNKSKKKFFYAYLEVIKSLMKTEEIIQCFLFVLSTFQELNWNIQETKNIWTLFISQQDFQKKQKILDVLSSDSIDDLVKTNIQNSIKKKYKQIRIMSSDFLSDIELLLYMQKNEHFQLSKKTFYNNIIGCCEFVTFIVAFCEKEISICFVVHMGLSFIINILGRIKCDHISTTLIIFLCNITNPLIALVPFIRNQFVAIKPEDVIMFSLDFGLCVIFLMLSINQMFNSKLSEKEPRNVLEQIDRVNNFSAFNMLHKYRIPFLLILLSGSIIINILAFWILYNQQIGSSYYWKECLFNSTLNFFTGNNYIVDIFIEKNEIIELTSLCQNILAYLTNTIFLSQLIGLLLTKEEITY